MNVREILEAQERELLAELETARKRVASLEWKLYEVRKGRRAIGNR